MRSSLFALSLLALTIGTADEGRAARRRYGGNVVVTNRTDFAVRVWIRQGGRLLKTARLQPMESVTSPRVRLGTNKTDPLDFEEVRVSARGLEPPIRGRNATDNSFFIDPPREGETHCYDITTFIIGEGEVSEEDVILFEIKNGDCDTDPEEPGDDDTDNGDGPDETTGQLDSHQERTVMIASSSGLAILAIVGCLLGRAPRRKEDRA